MADHLDLFDFFRRIFLILDDRGDDASVMDDTVLVGFSKEGNYALHLSAVKIPQSEQSLSISYIE